ncbi:MAG: lipopolysaccharide biosynthesis protein [Acidobacteria bacterium]|nr:lipopolysaccharide biosynthesis protein [Acidobacteriota bacterium]
MAAFVRRTSPCEYTRWVMNDTMGQKLQNGEGTSGRPAPEGPLTRATLTASFWATVNNVTTKGVGGVKTVVLARLLLPAHFGLMGLALATIGTVNMLSSPGIYTALIQKRHLDAADLNVGWWAHSARGCVLFLLFLPLSGWLAAFYGEPALGPILRAVSLTFVLDGFQSIGLVRLNRRLNFRRLMWMHQVSNAASLLTGVILAWLFRSVWALVAAHLAQLAGLLVMSYLLEPFRPTWRIQWERARTLMNFGKYVFATAVFYFLVVRGSEFLLGKMIGMQRYGYYALALSMVGMASGPIEQLITSVVFPSLSRIQMERERLAAAFSTVFRSAMLISAPVFVGIAIFGRDLVLLLLGAKWLPMTGPLLWLCFFAWFRILVQTFDVLHYAIGLPRIEALLRGLEFLLFAASIYPAISRYGATGAAAALFLVQAASLVFHILVARRYVAGLDAAMRRTARSFGILFAGQIVVAALHWRLGGADWLRFVLLGSLYVLWVVAFATWRERKLLESLRELQPGNRS